MTSGSRDSAMSAYDDLAGRCQQDNNGGIPTSGGRDSERQERCGATIKTGRQFPMEEHICVRDAGHVGKHLCRDCHGVWS